MNSDQKSYVLMVLDDAVDHMIGLYRGFWRPDDKEYLKTSLLLSMIEPQIEDSMTDKDIGYIIFDTLLELAQHKKNGFHPVRIMLQEICGMLAKNVDSGELICFDMMNELEEFLQAYLDSLEHIKD